MNEDKSFARAYALVSWGWSALIAMVGIAVLVNASTLPSPLNVKMDLPGRGTTGSTWVLAPLTLAVSILIGSLLYAAIILVIWILGKLVSIIVLVILNVLTVGIAANVLLSVLFQLDGTPLNRTNSSGLSWAEIGIGYALFAVNLAGTFMVARRISMGTWKFKR